LKIKKIKFNLKCQGTQLKQNTYNITNLYLDYDLIIIWRTWR